MEDAPCVRDSSCARVDSFAMIAGLPRCLAIDPIPLVRRSAIKGPSSGSASFALMVGESRNSLSAAGSDNIAMGLNGAPPPDDDADLGGGDLVPDEGADGCGLSPPISAPMRLFITSGFDIICWNIGLDRKALRSNGF